LALVHTDLCEFPAQSRTGFTWMMIFLDDFLGYDSIICLKRKSDAATAFRNWFALAEKVSGNKLLKLRSDRGGEYIISDLRTFLSTNGIEHQLTVPYTPQQNRRAEHFNRTLLEKSEAMRQHACLPPFFWQDAVETSLHIYNRQPIRRHNWHTPIQMWNGTKPDISYFKTFGCQAYVYIPKDRQANKLAPKSEDMIFIGYEPGTKGYRFWSKIRRTVVISSTATLIEFDFPNCPREKIPDKLPPINQSPNPSDDEESDPGGDDGHKPPDTFNQDDHQPGNNDSPGKPFVKLTEPWSGVQQLPSEDSDDSDDLYGPPPTRGPSKPAERTSTEVPRNTSSPAPNRPWVPRPDPIPRPRFPHTPHTEPSMGYSKNHPKAPMEPRICPPRLIKPVIQKDLVYGNHTPIQIEQEIRSEQDFV
jgi:hypothetical protein